MANTPFKEEEAEGKRGTSMKWFLAMTELIQQEISRMLKNKHTIRGE